MTFHTISQDASDCSHHVAVEKTSEAESSALTSPHSSSISVSAESSKSLSDNRELCDASEDKDRDSDYPESCKYVKVKLRIPGTCPR